MYVLYQGVRKSYLWIIFFIHRFYRPMFSFFMEPESNHSFTSGIHFSFPSFYVSEDISKNTCYTKLTIYFFCATSDSEALKMLSLMLVGKGRLVSSSLLIVDTSSRKSERFSEYGDNAAPAH